MYTDTNTKYDSLDHTTCICSRVVRAAVQQSIDFRSHFGDPHAAVIFYCVCFFLRFYAINIMIYNNYIYIYFFFHFFFCPVHNTTRVFFFTILSRARASKN